MTQKAESNGRRTRDNATSSTGSAEVFHSPVDLSSQWPLGWDAYWPGRDDIGVPWRDNSSPYSLGLEIVDSNTSTMDEEAIIGRDYWAVLLFLVPVFTVFGNVLVVLSICKEKSLQTATNYFILSLAVSDLMVATLVMPPSIYVEARTANSLCLSLSLSVCLSVSLSLLCLCLYLK